MYLLLLFILLLILMVFAIVLCDGDLVEPLVLTVESFALVTFIAFVYNKFDGTDFSGSTLLFIFLALLAYSVGYLLLKGLLQRTNLNTFTTNCRPIVFPKKMSSFCLLVLELAISILLFKKTLSIAMLINASANVMNMLQYTRSAYLFTDYSLGFGLSIANFFVLAVGYFYTYILLQEAFFSDKFSFSRLKDRKLELLIVVVSLLSGTLGTGRTFLIKYIVFIFVVSYYRGVITNKVRVFSYKKVVSTMKKMIFALTLFFLFFQILGLLTNKTSQLSAVDMLYGYSGAAVVALDRSIDTYRNDGRFFGEESFYGLYGFLNALGIEVPNRILHLPFVDIGKGNATNIYTSIRSYLYDFGYAGMFIVQFLLGVFSSIMYTLLRRLGGNPIYLLLYTILIYGTAMQGIEEITLRNFMSITNIFLLIFYAMLFFITQRTFKIR